MKELKKEVEVKLSPIDVAAMFCSMDDDEQCLFFNSVGIMVELWDNPFEVQMAGVSRNKILPLTDLGRKIMKIIGEYSIAPEQ